MVLSWLGWSWCGVRACGSVLPALIGAGFPSAGRGRVKGREAIACDAAGALDAAGPAVDDQGRPGRGAGAVSGPDLCGCSPSGGGGPVTGREAGAARLTLARGQ